MTQPSQTVKTILTQDSVFNLELFLHWYSGWLHDAEVTKNLMTLLDVYVASSSKEVQGKSIHNVISTVSMLIQLRELLSPIVEAEQPSQWKEAAEGWTKVNKQQ